MRWYYGFLVLLMGCSTMKQSLPQDAQVSMGSAYIFGSFELESHKLLGFTCAGGVALALKGPTREDFLAFDEPRHWSHGVKSYSVVPGEYQLNKWLGTHSRIGKDGGQHTGRKAVDYPFSLSFTAEPGTLYYIGDFDGRAQCMCASGKHCAYISAPNDNFNARLQELLEVYPALKDLRPVNLMPQFVYTGGGGDL
ncbi:hypothetical protein L1F30_00995 [Simiduia sp. 21SJ11W-1]|uniref:hypothetical protein n=1 Tax=Simiduia sp. 21SJ11W-1 TaxID=2909669 RepID=UPI0020A1FBA1|nr:hypothetical protein [Simiduia sp. 21SJ11W-1]UTA48132.1 hypothetical protein L1F30_00995 [Simiduia sp. 21SJ11W-1]